jgi:hypothetical protein
VLLPPFVKGGVAEGDEGIFLCRKDRFVEFQIENGITRSPSLKKKPLLERSGFFTYAYWLRNL